MTDEEKQKFDAMKDLVSRMAAQLSTLGDLAESAGFSTEGLKANVADLLREAGDFA